MAGTLTVRELITKWGFKTDSTPIKTLDSNIDKLKKRVRETGQGFRKFADGMGKVGRRLSVAVTAPILGIGAAMVKSAADAEESESKFEAVFKEMSGGVRAWSEKFGEAANRNTYALRDQAATFGALFSAMGFAGEASSKMSQQLTELTADLASFNNEAESDVLIALRSGMLGNVEPVIKYGADVRVAAVNQELLNMGFKKGVKGATEQQKMMARLNIIMRATKDAQGDAIKTAGSFTNQMKGLKAQLTKVAIVFGKQLIPALKPFVSKINELTVAFGKLSLEIRSSIVKWALIAAVVGPALIILAKVITAITVIGKALIWIKLQLVIFKAAMLGATAASMGLYAALLLIPAIMALLTYLVLKYWDEISAGLTKAGEWIKALFIKVFQWFDDLEIAIVLAFKRALSAVYEFFASIFSYLAKLPGKIWGGITSGFAAAMEWVKAKVLATYNWMKEKLGKVWGLIFGDDGEKKMSIKVEDVKAAAAGITPVAEGVGATIAPTDKPGASSSSVNYQPTINVTVPPGTPASEAERVADATANASTQTFRRALGDVSR